MQAAASHHCNFLVFLELTFNATSAPWKRLKSLPIINKRIPVQHAQYSIATHQKQRDEQMIGNDQTNCCLQPTKFAAKAMQSKKTNRSSNLLTHLWHHSNLSTSTTNHRINAVIARSVDTGTPQFAGPSAMNSKTRNHCNDCQVAGDTVHLSLQAQLQSSTN